MLEYLINHTWIIIIIKILAILLITYIISKVFDRIVSKSKLKDSLNFNFLRSILRALIWAFGGIGMLTQIPGMSTLTTTLLASSGVVAVVLTLGAQESFSNIISGLIIATSRPFNIGDRLIIKDGGTEIIGFVEDITLRHTVIGTFKNTKYIITNSKLDSMIIENTTRSDNEAGIVDFIDVSVSYESNLDKAIEILEKVVGDHPLYLDIRSKDDINNNVPKVTVRVRNFGSSGIDLRVNVRTRNIDDSFSACSECRKLIKQEFDKQGIEIPYNKVVVINKDS